MHSPPWRWHCVRTPTAGPTCGRAKERPDSDGPLRVQGWLSVCARTHARLYRCSAFRGGGSGRPATCTATPSSSSRPARRTTRRCPSPCQGMADRMPMRIRSGRSVGVICLRVLVWGRRVPWGWPGVSAPPPQSPRSRPPVGRGCGRGCGVDAPGPGGCPPALRPESVEAVLSAVDLDCLEGRWPDAVARLLPLVPRPGSHRRSP